MRAVKRVEAISKAVRSFDKKCQNKHATLYCKMRHAPMIFV